MTNIQSVAGSFAWTEVAALLMLITFEPVKVERPTGPAQFGAAAQAGTMDTAL